MSAVSGAAFHRVLDAAFPFHLVIAPTGIVTRVGRALGRILPSIVGVPLHDAMVVKRPEIKAEYAALRATRGTLVLLRAELNGLVLRGQIEDLDGDLLFLGSPWVTRPEDISEVGLTFGDFAAHDPVLDLLVEVQTRQQALSEARQLLTRLDRERQRAEDATRTKSDFLATMSHELRTPLNAILGMASLLLETTLDARQADFVDTIRVSGGQLLDIINDILDFTKIESKRLELEILPFDLFGCVEDAVDLVSPTASTRGVDLVYVVAPEVPARVVGDATRLRQILVNLLSNAVKFTPQGRVCLRVTAQPGEWLRFAVSDTGIGIAPERISAIFEPFSQADPSISRHYGGTGLGLSISSRLVQLMGGELDAESELGKGSQFGFTVRLPARPSAPTPDELQNVTVLVIDADAEWRECIAGTLRALNVSAVAASYPPARSATGGVRTLSQGPTPSAPISAIVAGVHADEDPGGVIASIRLAWPTTPVILGRPLQHVEADEAGDMPTVRMPVRRATLARALRSVLGKHAEAQRRRQSVPPQVSLRILVVEDNITNQKVALAMLGRLGYIADVVASGQEAIDTLARRPYDVVLMDVQMPEMDGLEATRRIRAAKLSYSPRIIALTASAVRGDREKCIAAGMNDYLTKPVRLAELKSCLDGVAISLIGRVGRTVRPPPPAPPVAEASERLIVDKGRVTDLGIDRELLGSIIDVYVQDAKRRIDALRDALGSDDFVRVRSSAHALKGSSANLGVLRVEERCRRLETGAETLSEESVAALERELDEAAEILRAMP